MAGELRFRKSGGVSVQDQFGTIVEDIKRPRRFCNAVDKNGGGIIDATKHLLLQGSKSGGTTDEEHGLHPEPVR